ncbi:NAD(P)/FAD-dependent oxidoreductase [Brucella melitensis]|uniref:FAD-dependent oxidoreductase n=1 Tax=Brucella melitensis TaxID=29459 RepID=UPI0031FE034E
MLIVGAGISGLALARALWQFDIETRILDKRNQHAEAGLAINLPGNAIQALERLGLKEQVDALGYPTKRREYRTAKGKLLFSVNETDFWGERHQPRCILRSDLLRILQEGNSQDNLLYGKEVVEISQDAGRVSVALSDNETMETACLIGADGINSITRTLAFNGNAVRAAALSNFSWRFMAPNPGVDCWSLWVGSKSIILLIPVSEQSVYVWATLTGNRTDSGQVRLSGEHFSDFPSDLRSIIENAVKTPQDVYNSPLQEVRMDRWSAGNVLLLGDAAHATAPVWAQGAALGMEAALTLAKLVSQKVEQPELFDQFEKLHRPRVNHVVAMTDKMSKAAKIPSFAQKLLLPIVGPRNYEATYGPLRDGNF